MYALVSAQMNRFGKISSRVADCRRGKRESPYAGARTGTVRVTRLLASASGDDERPDGLLVAEYPYFERDEPMTFDDPGTYVETEVTFVHNLTHQWNHGLGELVTALLGAGMELTMLVEHDSVPWEAPPGQMTQVELGEWRLTERPWRLPHSYTLQAMKNR
jgi:hypothetical protein